MTYPGGTSQVRELAGKDPRIPVPVAVTYRVLKLCRAQYYRWLAAPVTASELTWAYRTNPLFYLTSDRLAGIGESYAFL